MANYSTYAPLALSAGVEGAAVVFYLIHTLLQKPCPCSKSSKTLTFLRDWSLFLSILYALAPIIILGVVKFEVPSLLLAAFVWIFVGVTLAYYIKTIQFVEEAKKTGCACFTSGIVANLMFYWSVTALATFGLGVAGTGYSLLSGSYKTSPAYMASTLTPAASMMRTAA